MTEVKRKARPYLSQEDIGRIVGEIEGIERLGEIIGGKNVYDVPDDVLTSAIEYILEGGLISNFQKLTSAFLSSESKIPDVSADYVSATYDLPVRDCPEFPVQPELRIRLTNDGDSYSGFIMQKGFEDKIKYVVHFLDMPMDSS